VNFCCNPRCAQYGVAPDPFVRTGRRPAHLAGVPRGTVSGYKTRRMLSVSRLRHNIPTQEQPRGRRGARASTAPARDRPHSAGLPRGRLRQPPFGRSRHPDRYQCFGTTKGGDPRWRCQGCRKTFSAGRPARRHKRSDKDRLVLETLCNDLSLAKVSTISGLSYCAFTGTLASSTIR
jgi:hypothetical protein